MLDGRTEGAEPYCFVADGSGCVRVVDSSWKPIVTERGDCLDCLKMSKQGQAGGKLIDNPWRASTYLLPFVTEVFSGLGSIFMNWNSLINGAMVFQCDCPWSCLPEVLSTFETTTNQKQGGLCLSSFLFLLFWCCLCRPVCRAVSAWSSVLALFFVVPLGGQS